MRIPWKHVGIAALSLFAATAVRGLLEPWLAARVPYVTYFVAIVYVAWRTSTPVALASIAASWFIAAHYFIAGGNGLGHLSTGDWIGSAAYFTVTVSIALIGDRMRRAQRQLAHSERQLELISNRLPALIAYISSDRRYVWCNDEYTRWFGLVREQVIGRTVEEVLGATAWQAIGPRLDIALAGRVVEYETEARYARGGSRWIHVVYTPHTSADGTVQGLVSMVRDISDRKRAERSAAVLAGFHEAFAQHPSVEVATRHVAEKLVQEFGLSRCILGEVDEGADTIRVFQQASRAPEPSQAGDYRISDFLTEEERRHLVEGRPLVISDVRIGRSAAAAARFLSLGVGAVVSAPYVLEGKRKFALAAEKSAPHDWKEDEVDLLREIAARLYAQLDRARAEEAVLESERRYRLLASVLTDIPCSIDPAGRFVAPQEAWSRYTGQSYEQASGFGWFEALHPEDRAPARAAWDASSRARRPYEMRARLWRAATAQYRHVIARAAPLFDETGDIREWVGACTDIHEETEQALALIEADKRKDEFLATLAHELRNPLAPIRNGLYILKTTGKAEGALGAVHAMLERQMRQLVRLVDDLLEVSRITRGRIELRRERTALQDIVGSAVETAQPAIDEAGHSLAVSLPAEPLYVDADPVRLAQVVTNLLNNAVKFTDRGGQIALGARRDGTTAIISVRDNGRGIAADVLPHIFDLFVQGSHGREYAPGGLGIGLTLAQSLVQLHGGTLEAHSEGLRRGSEFTVRLPIDGGEAGKAADPHPARVAPGRLRRVLIVDDNKDAADSLGILLALQGFETRTAHDGRVALEELADFRPEVILLDLGMPGLSGYEVAERVHQHPEGRRVAIVALSGWGQARDRERSRDAGIDHHLVKPVDPETLRELLARLLADTEAA